MIALEEFGEPQQDLAWRSEDLSHTAEPEWCSRRLFETEEFDGTILDPACGTGTIVREGQALGNAIFGTDLVDRGGSELPPQNFFDLRTKVANIVTYPPPKLVDNFALHALSLAQQKVAIILPTKRISLAGWIKQAPLARVYLLMPRPMPDDPRDYCWAVFDREHSGPTEVKSLRRNTDK